MQLVGKQIYNLNIARIKNNTKKWNSEIHFVHTDDSSYPRLRYPRYSITYSSQSISSLLIPIPSSDLLIMIFHTMLTVLILIYL